MKDGLTIGQLARRAGVNVETVRYYERRRLVPEPPRTPSGYRQYPPDTVRRLAFIKRAQSLGFTLAEIDELLSLRVDPASTCGDVEQKAQQTMGRIERKMGELAVMHDALHALAAACRDGRPTSECPIIEMLETAGT